MKKILSVLFILSLVSFISAQDLNQIEYTQNLDIKKKVLFSDAVTMFVYQLNRKPSTFDKDAKYLLDQGIIKKIYPADKPLRRGTIAYMTVKHLKINDSLMFKITKSERYAFYVCVSYKIMDKDGSENDILSGGELLEIFNSISEFGGEK